MQLRVLTIALVFLMLYILLPRHEYIKIKIYSWVFIVLMYWKRTLMVAWLLALVRLHWEYFTHIGTSPLPAKGCKFRPINIHSVEAPIFSSFENYEEKNLSQKGRSICFVVDERFIIPCSVFSNTRTFRKLSISGQVSTDSKLSWWSSL